MIRRSRRLELFIPRKREEDQAPLLWDKLEALQAVSMKDDGKQPDMQEMALALLESAVDAIERAQKERDALVKSAIDERDTLVKPATPGEIIAVATKRAKES